MIPVEVACATSIGLVSVRPSIAKIVFFVVAIMASSAVLPAFAQTNGESAPSQENEELLEDEQPTIELSPRAEDLVDRAHREQWDVDELLEYLELHHIEECLHFGDRSHLRERHARWREAIDLLAVIDPQRLQSWVLGLEEPPAAVLAETERQLRCLLSDLIAAAADDTEEIRLFRRIHNHFGGAFSDASELARAIESNPRLFDRAARAITRSVHRNLYSQGFIWYRKFRFTGRPFNRISAAASEECSLGEAVIWNPDSDYHRRCWQRILTPEQRETEILKASAAPGLSRHHWGSDVDILGLNPAFFEPGGVLHGDWRWLDANGLDYGFFQPYGAVEQGVRAHMEERWHWSYYPIGQALWDYLYEHQDHFEKVLFERWDRLESRWGSRRGPYFGHMRQYWRDYLFNIDLPNVDAEPSVVADEESNPP